MDDIVKQAMNKWPNVPHCYGWLALDARGAWRMRDERAQQLGLPGDKLTHGALVNFINRNYAADDRGCWFFQNGPQRVYLNLETAPFIAHTDPQLGLVLHTGEAAGQPDAAWLTEQGALLLDCAGQLAQLDDRDMAAVMNALELNGAPLTDDALLDWLAGTPGTLSLHYLGRRIPVEPIAHEQVSARFHFTRLPGPPA